MKVLSATESSLSCLPMSRPTAGDEGRESSTRTQEEPSTYLIHLGSHFTQINQPLIPIFPLARGGTDLRWPDQKRHPLPYCGLLETPPSRIGGSPQLCTIVVGRGTQYLEAEPITARFRYNRADILHTTTASIHWRSHSHLPLSSLDPHRCVWMPPPPFREYIVV